MERYTLQEELKYHHDKINELIGIDKRIESEVKDLKNLILKK